MFLSAAAAAAAADGGMSGMRMKGAELNIE